MAKDAANDASGHNPPGLPHECVNPAGHTRGFCKSNDFANGQVCGTPGTAVASSGTYAPPGRSKGPGAGNGSSGSTQSPNTGGAGGNVPGYVSSPNNGSPIVALAPGQQWQRQQRQRRGTRIWRSWILSGSARHRRKCRGNERRHAGRPHRAPPACRSHERSGLVVWSGGGEGIAWAPTCVTEARLADGCGRGTAHRNSSVRLAQDERCCSVLPPLLSRRDRVRQRRPADPPQKVR
jgi:hypothetical protein